LSDCELLKISGAWGWLMVTFTCSDRISQWDIGVVIAKQTFDFVNHLCFKKQYKRIIAEWTISKNIK